MIKGNGGGLSIAADPYGRTINASDYFNANQKQMITCLPAKGVVTIYSIIGDFFKWLCVLGFVIMSVWGYVIGKRTSYICVSGLPQN